MVVEGLVQFRDRALAVVGDRDEPAPCIVRIGFFGGRPRSTIASTARDTQLLSRLTRVPSSDSGIGPERSSSVSSRHGVLVVRQQSATTHWARVYSRAGSRSSPHYRADESIMWLWIATKWPHLGASP